MASLVKKNPYLSLLLTLLLFVVLTLVVFGMRQPPSVVSKAFLNEPRKEFLTGPPSPPTFNPQDPIDVLRRIGRLCQTATYQVSIMPKPGTKNTVVVELPGNAKDILTTKRLEGLVGGSASQKSRGAIFETYVGPFNWKLNNQKNYSFEFTFDRAPNVAAFAMTSNLVVGSGPGEKTACGYWYRF